MTFSLRYQARFETNGSAGGFLLRSHPPGQGGWNQVETRAVQDKLLPWNGILMRSADNDQGDTVFDYRAASLAHSAIQDWTKEWVDFEVRAEGGRISVWVNGFLLSKAEDVPGWKASSACDASAKRSNTATFRFGSYPKTR